MIFGRSFSVLKSFFIAALISKPNALVAVSVPAVDPVLIVVIASSAIGSVVTIVFVMLVLCRFLIVVPQVPVVLAVSIALALTICCQ